MTLHIPPGEFQAYIFDCDGTLADTMPLHYRAWLAAVGRLGCEFPEDLFYSLGGVPAPGVVEFLNARYGVSMPVIETARSTPAFSSAPIAIAVAVSLLTAPKVASVIALTPSIARLASLE